MASSYLEGKNFERYMSDVVSFQNAGSAFTGIASEYGIAGLHFSEGRIRCKDCTFDYDMQDLKLCCPRREHGIKSPTCRYLLETSEPDNSEMIVKDIMFGSGKPYRFSCIHQQMDL